MPVLPKPCVQQVRLLSLARASEWSKSVPGNILELPKTHCTMPLLEAFKTSHILVEDETSSSPLSAHAEL